MKHLPAILLCLTTVGASFAQSDSEPQTSRNIGYATYEEKSGRIDVFVGAQAAAISQHEAYIPLQIVVGVSGAGPELQVSPSAFVLIDSAGKTYPPASVDEMAKQASLIQYMNEYRKTSPLQTGNAFSMSRPIESNFYPLEGKKFFTDAHLDRDTYCSDVLFFPTPDAGLAGVMQLQMLTQGMQGAVYVKFEAPVKQNRHEKPSKKRKEK